jgi:hypothetical protein
MSADIRLPIGLLFSIVGVLITIFGLATGGNEMYVRHSLGININIYCGVCVTAFGVIMLAMALHAQKKNKAQAQSKT